MSNFLKRYLEANAAHTWAQVKTELSTRFSELTDSQHALMLLRKVKQKQEESIQVYAERLLALGDKAFPNQVNVAVDQQLIGLVHDYMKIKIMRENPATLQAAITTATNEKNFRKRFALRSSNNSRALNGSDTDTQPMEVDHLRPQFRCFKCNRRGHKARECRTRSKVNAISNSLIRADNKGVLMLSVGIARRLGTMQMNVE